MTEDEEWEMVERKLKAKERWDQAVVESVIWVDGLTNRELSIFTLRAAFEMGYRRGAKDVGKKSLD